MTEDLIIVFVKNTKIGKVKTRLAKTIGNQAALKVYQALVTITKKAIIPLPVDKRIYFSETIEEIPWKAFYKTTQKGLDLGERMNHAINEGFRDGYKRIVLIGSDLPDMKPKILKEALETLKSTPIVLGPATDGGYYLVGLSKPHSFIFDNKPWSQPHLLETTLRELEENKVSYTLLKPLNDIDTFEDLKGFDLHLND